MRDWPGAVSVMASPSTGNATGTGPIGSAPAVTPGARGESHSEKAPHLGWLVGSILVGEHDGDGGRRIVDVDGAAGGDDAADCLRYLIATKGRSLAARKLRGV